MPDSTIQEWVFGLTRMQQAVLLTAIRGPDGLPGKHPAKFLLRWYRRCILVTAFEGYVFGEGLEDAFKPGGGNFTGPVFPVEPDTNLNYRVALDGVLEDYLDVVDEIPHHFYLHLMHATEILGYKHPTPEVREWWHSAYLKLVRDMHLNPETAEQMDRRLGDSEKHWREADKG